MSSNLINLLIGILLGYLLSALNIFIKSKLKTVLNNKQLDDISSKSYFNFVGDVCNIKGCSGSYNGCPGLAGRGSSSFPVNKIHGNFNVYSVRDKPNLENYGEDLLITTVNDNSNYVIANDLKLLLTDSFTSVWVSGRYEDGIFYPDVIPKTKGLLFIIKYWCKLPKKMKYGTKK